MYAKRLEKLYSVFYLFKTRTKVYQKEMKKLTGITQPSIVRELQKLKEDKLIESKHKDSKGKGPGCNIWRLTHYGLWMLLEKSPKEREVIINTHKDRLLAFKKWTRFKKAGVDHALLDNLNVELFASGARKFLSNREGYEVDWGTETEWAESMNRAIIMPLIKYPQGEGDLTPLILMKVCQEDAELKAFVDKQISNELSEQEIKVRKMRCLSHVWNKTKLQDWGIENCKIGGSS